MPSDGGKCAQLPIPNFLVIGDLKAGSSSLNHYLRQHPQVYTPENIKELRYFSFDSSNPYHLTAESTRVRSFDEYQAYFKNSGAALAVGESSPNYLRSPVAAQRIANEIPDVKLIVCLRNPADRLYSVHMMSYRSGSTNLTFEERAFRENCAWIKGNFYWADLKKYMDLFCPDQLKVILFDDLKSDAAAVTRDLYRFLGVDDTFVPDFSIQNQGGMPKNRFVFSSLIRAKRLVKRFARPPEFLARIWANVKTRSMYRQEMDAVTRRNVLAVFHDDIMRTQDLIGRDLRGWLE